MVAVVAAVERRTEGPEVLELSGNSDFSVAAVEQRICSDWLSKMHAKGCMVIDELHLV